MIRMIVLLLCFAGGPALAEAPPLMLANRYHTDIDVRQYWISEKLDGVRAYWDGRQLISRNGHPLPAPTWFTRDFPTTPMDGELWAGRQSFEQVIAAFKSGMDNDPGWRKLGYWVFDLPAEKKPFSQRLNRLQQLVTQAGLPHLHALPQWRVKNAFELFEQLDQVVADGGEGLMLHRAASHYSALRSDDLVKLKRHRDAEASVIGHLPGKGKYRGMLGSLLVKDAEGRRFKLGSGLSDAQRRQPPPVGAIVTYKYYGLTANGLPRFASFLRVREHPGASTKMPREGGAFGIDEPTVSVESDGK